MAHAPTLKQLKYFVSVVEHNHFGKAAKACFVSQSTLSSGISDLEDNLEVVLIERETKGISLTSIGKDIYQRAQSILTSTEDLVELASSSKDLFSSELRLGVIPTIAPFILPQILSNIRESYPQFKVFIREALSEQLVSELKSGKLDVLLLALPFAAVAVKTKHLYYDDFLFAAQKENKLVKGHKKNQKIKLDDILHQDLMLLEDGHCIRDHALDACRMKASDLQLPYQATSLNTIVQMVASDMGITILPKMAVDANILGGTDVVVRRFSEKHIWRSIGLMWRSKSPRDEEFSQFGEFVLKSLGRSDENV